MDIKKFITGYGEAFGPGAELPVAFWYSDAPAGTAERVNGCFFKCFSRVRQGERVSLDEQTMGCGGGKLYSGFTTMPEHVPNFVSIKERYKQTPQMVRDFVEGLHITPQMGRWLNFARIDRLEEGVQPEGYIFLATPDILSGLVSWTFYDNNAPDAVNVTFGSGCSATVAQATTENRNGGHRTFMGMFDPSARPWFEENILSFTIPASRMERMQATLADSCLGGAHDWLRIRQRINKNDITNGQ